MSYKAPLASTTSFGIMKVGTNLTVINGLVSASGLTTDSYDGKFFSSTTQTNTAVNTALTVTFPNTAINRGITTTGPTIVFPNAGVYTITYELQAEVTTGGGGDIDVWVLVNGVILPNSNSIRTVAGGGNRIIINRSFLVSLPANSTMAVNWSSSVANMQLTAVGTQTGPTRPATNSANFLATLVRAL